MTYIPPPAADATLDRSADPPLGDDSRGIAMLNYGLLFASVFFAGVPALIAVALAYSRKSKAEAGLARHFRFQIKIFWTAFFFALIAAACGFAGMVMAVVELARATGGAWSLDGFELKGLQVDGGMLALLVAAIVISLLDAAWVVIAAAVGFIRLASDHSLGKSAA